VVTDNVERQLAAERRGWVFEILWAGQPNEESRLEAVHATLMEADEAEADDAGGEQFSGEGDDPLGSLLDQIEAFDQEHGRL
jgi:hypothetical protein